eukprot:1147146-Pelagomonas_calceolata.AAC.1
MRGAWKRIDILVGLQHLHFAACSLGSFGPQVVAHECVVYCPARESFVNGALLRNLSVVSSTEWLVVKASCADELVVAFCLIGYHRLGSRAQRLLEIQA